MRLWRLIRRGRHTEIVATNKEYLKVEGRQIAVSNLDKVFYPGGRFTKAQVIDYYVRIADYLLPHLKNRPVTLKRFPNGVFGEFFYEKDAPAFTPAWVKTFPVPRRERTGEDIRYVLINDLSTLVWLANLANLEIHPFLHQAPKIDRPTSIVFDCDPGAGADLLSCARVALMLRELLAELDLDCWPKVSGSKGLQVYVPLNTPVNYETTQGLAKAIAEVLAQREPELIVADMSKALRRQRVFIDWSQNAHFKTTVGVYSLRAKSHKPLVSLPVRWRELEAALSANDASPLYFSPEAALLRANKLGDLFKPVLSRKQRLPREFNRASLQPKPSRKPAMVEPTARGNGLRRSAQGGRRRYLVKKTDAWFEVSFEMGDALKTWRLKKSLPTKERQERQAVLRKDESVPESAFRRRREATWDIGTYEINEGSIKSGQLRLFLEGKRLRGEWSLTREEANQWKLKKQ